MNPFCDFRFRDFEICRKACFKRNRKITKSQNQKIDLLFLFNMVIQHKQLQGKGMFYVGQDGAILAEMVYTMAPNKMIIEHTEVDESLEGKGVGKQLVHTAVEYARTHNIKIVPLCPFAKSVLDKMTEWQDVLA
jgi:predicted GNAT family acetyltransferase